MIFSTQNLWSLCETFRKQNSLTASELSRLVFKDKPSSFYGTKCNRLNGGVSIPFKVLQYFKVENLLFIRFNPTTKQTITIDLFLQGKTINEIIKELVYVVLVLSYDINEIALPQTLRRAIHEENLLALLSLKTFTKAFNLLSNTSFEIDQKSQLDKMF
jgi:hypothetical protein